MIQMRTTSCHIEILLLRETNTLPRMTNQNTIGESLFLSPRDFALGALVSPLQGSRDGVKRFLEDDEEVTFTLDHMIGSTDAEFLINNDPSRRMQFSQLCSFFLCREGRSLYSGTVSAAGVKASLATMNVDTFMNLVTGRRFRVSVDSSMYAINTFSPRCGRFSTMSQLRDFICDSLDGGRYDDVTGMTRSNPCYNLTQVQ